MTKIGVGGFRFGCGLSHRIYFWNPWSNVCNQEEFLNSGQGLCKLREGLKNKYTKKWAWVHLGGGRGLFRAGLGGKNFWPNFLTKY